ncbi:MAG: hypothetical protein UU89_C0017G0037, partial [Parcubacteria group bacterium GW2011_GWC2_42_11]
MSGAGHTGVIGTDELFELESYRLHVSHPFCHEIF